jgi:ABC-type lipoprotein export system ATPase subunit
MSLLPTQSPTRAHTATTPVAVRATHDPHAAAIADRAVFLADGELVRDLGACSAHEVLAVVEELSTR